MNLSTQKEAASFSSMDREELRKKEKSDFKARAVTAGFVLAFTSLLTSFLIILITESEPWAPSLMLVMFGLPFALVILFPLGRGIAGALFTKQKKINPELFMFFAGIILPLASWYLYHLANNLQHK